MEDGREWAREAGGKHNEGAIEREGKGEGDTVSSVMTPEGKPDSGQR